MRLIDAEEMHQWVLRAADNTAEKGINKQNFNLPQAEINVHFETAAYIYSVLFDVKEGVAEKAIKKTAETYTRGNMTGVEGAGKEIREHITKMGGGKKTFSEKEMKKLLKELIEELFRRGGRRYNNYHREQGYHTYFIVMYTLYDIVFHLWGGNYLDTHWALERTIKNITVEKQKTSYIELYKSNLEERLNHQEKI